MLIGSPPCTKFSILMNLLLGRKDLTPERRAQFYAEPEVAVEQINFCCTLYWKQVEAGR